MPIIPTPRAALYARVSTHHGQDVGLQLDALRQVVEVWSWVVVEEFLNEGISGTKTSRPGLDAIREACRLGKVDVVARISGMNALSPSREAGCHKAHWTKPLRGKTCSRRSA